jgi:DNA-binding MarR family transcriptional regulator
LTNSVNDSLAGRLGVLFGLIRASFDGPEWDGLRQSHLRLLSHVPTDGARLTDLAASLGMTKQGAGQLAALLVERGLVAQEVDPDDRRARRVSRTPVGEGLLARADAHLARLEERWAEEVGPAAYATFRRVVDELSDPLRSGPAPDPGPG